MPIPPAGAAMTSTTENGVGRGRGRAVWREGSFGKPDGCNGRSLSSDAFNLRIQQIVACDLDLNSHNGTECCINYFHLPFCLLRLGTVSPDLLRKRPLCVGRQRLRNPDALRRDRRNLVLHTGETFVNVPLFERKRRVTLFKLRASR